MSSRRDYKSAPTGQHRQRARRNGLLVVTLMLIGLFGGLLAYIRGDRPQPPTTVAVAPSAPAPPAAAPTAPPPKAVVAAPAAEPEPAKPKYDFYTELPKRQIDIHPEAAKPKNAPQPAPARLQPAVNQRYQPSAPRGNAKAPMSAVAAASGSRPDSKVATTKTAGSKSAAVKPATPETASSKSTPAPSKSAAAKPATPETASSKSTPAPSKSATAKPATPETASSKSTPAPSKSATAKPANVTPAPATTPVHATPSRPLANNSSKIIVKTP